MKPEDYTKYFEAAQKYNEELAAHPSAFYNPDEIKDYEKILDITGTGIMGYITIKKLGVELPIYHGTDEGILQIAAGHLKGTSFPISGESTHSVISAHRGLPSAKLFTDLDKMEIGDTFSITVLNQCHLVKHVTAEAFQIDPTITASVIGILLLILLLIRVLIRTRKKGREGRYSRYDQALLYMKKTDILKNNKRDNNTKN